MTCIMTCIQPSPTQAHCGAANCHETFGAVSGFDRHRRGGLCVDPSTIKGLHRAPNGIWRWDGRDPHADAHSRSSRAPQSDEPPEWVPECGSDGFEPANSRSGGPEVWSDAVPPGGYVCAAPDPDRPDGICGMPVESEPCLDHAKERA